MYSIIGPDSHFMVRATHLTDLGCRPKSSITTCILQPSLGADKRVTPLTVCKDVGMGTIHKELG